MVFYVDKTRTRKESIQELYSDIKSFLLEELPAQISFLREWHILYEAAKDIDVGIVSDAAAHTGEDREVFMPGGIKTEGILHSHLINMFKDRGIWENWVVKIAGLFSLSTFIHESAHILTGRGKVNWSLKGIFLTGDVALEQEGWEDPKELSYVIKAGMMANLIAGGIFGVITITAFVPLNINPLVFIAGFASLLNLVSGISEFLPGGEVAALKIGSISTIVTPPGKEDIKKILPHKKFPDLRDDPRETSIYEVEGSLSEVPVPTRQDYSLPAITGSPIVDDTEDNVLDTLMPLLEIPNDLVALVSTMSDLLKTIEVRDVIKVIDTLPINEKAQDAEKDNLRKKAHLHMALRTALMSQGLKKVDPHWGYVVGQVVPFQRSGQTGHVNRRAGRNLSFNYNGVEARSVLTEADEKGNVSKDAYRELVRNVIDQMQEIRGMPYKDGSKGLFKIPREDKDVFENLLKEAKIDPVDIKVQYVDQDLGLSVTPDNFSTFVWGVEVLDHVRKVEEAIEAGKKAPAPSRGLVLLTQAMVTGLEVDGIKHEDAETILQNLFKPGSVLLIRKVDWESFREQHRAWEVVARSL